MFEKFLSGIKTTIKQFCCKSREVEKESQLHMGCCLMMFVSHSKAGIRNLLPVDRMETRIATRLVKPDTERLL
jgi:hypothetical protein